MRSLRTWMPTRLPVVRSSAFREKIRTSIRPLRHCARTTFEPIRDRSPSFGAKRRSRRCCSHARHAARRPRRAEAITAEPVAGAARIIQRRSGSRSPRQADAVRFGRKPVNISHAGLFEHRKKMCCNARERPVRKNNRCRIRFTGEAACDVTSHASLGHPHRAMSIWFDARHR
jgi:hypothetical protein